MKREPSEDVCRCPRCGMLCGADSIQVASSAAFGGMLRLLG